MKNLLVALVLMTTALGFSQRGEHKQHRNHQKADLTVEQMATLQGKKMALALDLTDSQIEQLYPIHLENAKLRKEKMTARETQKEAGTFKKPTDDELFELQNAMLDRKIAVQSQLKDILSDEQFEEWKKMSHRKHKKGKKRMSKEGRRG